MIRRTEYEQERGEERGRGKREPVRMVNMAKDFYFQTPMTDFMFKFKLSVSSKQQQLILNKLQSYEVGLTQFLAKLKKNLSISQIFN